MPPACLLLRPSTKGFGAADGNRTRTLCLEGRHATVTSLPHMAPCHGFEPAHAKLNSQTFLQTRRQVGVLQLSLTERLSSQYRGSQGIYRVGTSPRAASPDRLASYGFQSANALETQCKSGVLTASPEGYFLSGFCSTEVRSKQDNLPKSGDLLKLCHRNFPFPPFRRMPRQYFGIGAPSGTRTQDLLIKSQLLLPTELRAHMVRVTGLEPVTDGLKGRYSTS